MQRYLAILVGTGLAIMAIASSAQSAGDYARRASAELLVMRGDARRLAETNVLPLHKKGLTARLRGGLSSLGVVLRQAGSADPERIRMLRAALDKGNLTEFTAGVQALYAERPLVVPGILPPVPTQTRLERGQAIHRSACAGCHDFPNAEVSLPARDLFEEARTLSAEEFAARLLLGIRGDVLTGLANPFSDEDLVSLMVFYLDGRR